MIRRSGHQERPAEARRAPENRTRKPGADVLVGPLAGDYASFTSTLQHWCSGSFLGEITLRPRPLLTTPFRPEAREQAELITHTSVGPRSPSATRGQESRDRPTPSGPTHLCLMSPSTGSSAAPACCRRIRSLILFLAVDLVHPALIGSCGSRASLSAVVPRRCTSASSVRSTPHAG